MTEKRMMLPCHSVDVDDIIIVFTLKIPRRWFYGELIFWETDVFTWDRWEWCFHVSQSMLMTSSSRLTQKVPKHDFRKCWFFLMRMPINDREENDVTLSFDWRWWHHHHFHSQNPKKMILWRVDLLWFWCLHMR